MGFGKKKDPITNRTIDLDETYKKIIKPSVEECKCKCIRADEITESGMIDKSMYTLLFKADIVIADITTLNPNALYELGVRHVFKKYSTIIIQEGTNRIPFDINHIRILNYEFLGNVITKKEAENCKANLVNLINTIISNPQLDSPIYTFLPQLKEPSMEDIDELVEKSSKMENTIYSLTEKAIAFRDEKRYVEAEEIWKDLSSKLPNDIYYIQQQALCRYKSKTPSELKACTDALQIINSIKIKADSETLGIAGAINKTLYKLTKDTSYLDDAIQLYQKGWAMFDDYYNGENFATCTYLKSKVEDDEEMRIYYKMNAKITFQKVIQITLSSLPKEEEDNKWKYATLSNAYLATGDKEEAIKYEKLFMDQATPFDKETFNNTKKIFANENL